MYSLGDLFFKKKTSRALYAVGETKNIICPVCPTWGVCPISGFSLRFSVRFSMGVCPRHTGACPITSRLKVRGGLYLV